MERKKASDFPPEVLKLFDGYIHGALPRRDFLDRVIIPFNARLSTPLVPTVRGIYADGDMVIVMWDGAGIALDGKSYENTYSLYLKMRDGKIIEATAFFDSIAFDDLWKRVRPGR